MMPYYQVFIDCLTLVLLPFPKITNHMTRVFQNANFLEVLD
jgi:hypothetical protein